MKIGYLIPEFPGQTHIFFWREIEALRARGVDVDLVSTRRPPAGIITHSWSQEAMGRTIYLTETGLTEAAEVAAGLMRAGAARWLAALSSWRRAEGLGLFERVRLVAVVALAARLAEIARRRAWTHLHVHSCADSAHLALFSRLLGGPTYSMTLHGNLGRFGENHRQKWRHARFAIVVNRLLLDEVQQTLSGALPRAVVVAPMGVETSSFVRRTPYQPWRGEGVLRMFTCARLNEVKGHIDLIRAVMQLRAEGIDARLDIAGEDDHGGAGYRRDLEAFISVNGLHESVCLLGALPENEVRAGLERAHVFALASHWEALPVAPIEAMAMGLPVVVAAVGGVPELIADGEDGLLAPPATPAAFAAAIGRIARDPELAVALGAMARRKVEQEFRSDRSAEVIVRLLRDEP